LFFIDLIFVYILNFLTFSGPPNCFSNFLQYEVVEESIQIGESKIEKQFFSCSTSDNSGLSEDKFFSEPFFQ